MMYDLFIACKNNDIRAVQVALGQNDVNYANDYGDTALLWAVVNKNLEIVKLLLINDANINHATKDGNTALILAVYNNHPEMVKLLLTNGANINHINLNGNTALIWAVIKNNPEIVVLLLKTGAKINRVNKNGNTALKLATERKYENIKNIITLYSVLHVKRSFTSDRRSRDQLTISYLQVIPRDIISVIERFL